MRESKRIAKFNFAEAIDKTSINHLSKKDMDKVLKILEKAGY